MIKIYTDGSCKGNPGRGASAFVVIKEEALAHRAAVTFVKTTNNEAELTAAMLAIDYIIANDIQECQIYSDSQYVVNGINEWMQRWAMNGWQASAGKYIKNVEVWQHVYELWNRAKSASKCTIHYVKGHHADKWNLLVDKYVQGAVKEMK